MRLDKQDINRFRDPLYTVAEASRYLGRPDSTLRDWTHGYRKQRGSSIVQGGPLLTTVTSGPRQPVIPFVGLAEGMVLAAMRESGVPLQRIRPAVARLQADIGLEHALASRRLFTDGAEVLYDYAERSGDEIALAARELVVVRHGQRVFNDVVRSYLPRIEFSDDGYARLIRLPGYQRAELVVDPLRGFGQSVFIRGGARLEDALSMFWAGESLDVVADEYGVPRDQLEDAVRVDGRRKAA